MAELLIELFSEEIPARMQDQAGADLARLVGAGLTGADLPAAAMRAYATPRRLTLMADGIAAFQPDRTVERRGPRVDAPEQARTGFFASLKGIEHRIAEREEGKKGRVLYALIDQTGAPAARVIKDLLEAILPQFPWPKSMRWGEGDARWVRPLHAMICLFDGEVVPLRFAGIVAGRTTFGHRFMAPEPIEASGFADYAEKLQAAKVVLDHGRRRTLILERARRLADEAGLVLADDGGLLDELAGLVEWPVPLIGRIEPRFIDLPPEVLVTSMREHQRYLSTRNADGTLADRFVAVANTETADGGATIIAGYERVLRARLWDAAFFWDKDREQRLESRLPQLGRMVFHAELGTLEEKARRLAALSGVIASYVDGCEAEAAERAALLAKCDLVTGMVGEFPELQGVMGGYYARHQGEPEAVAAAIAEHHAPRGPDDACPAAPVSVAVALADKIDSLAGFFAAGIRPTGSKDPFALRRAALGTIRLIVENGLRLPMASVFHQALDLYGRRFASAGHAALARELVGFLIDRLQVQQRAKGARHDLIAAVAATGQDDDLVRVLARVDALRSLLATDDGANLLAGWRRATNIVGIEEKKDKATFQGEPEAALLVDPAEQRLAAELAGARTRITAALGREDFVRAMESLATLRAPVDRFFDEVLVNAKEPELRMNRLRLLATIRAALDDVADFALIEDPQAARA